jgi:predicted  nucleic acid-binding Zn-ribbon protein
MVTLEQVKLLETKVVKALDYARQVGKDNILLKGKLDTYQKRIDELEASVQRFKEEQSRIEEGILSALDRLNQFEDALEKSLPTEGKEELEGAENSPPEESPVSPEESQENPPEAGEENSSILDSAENPQGGDEPPPPEAQSNGELDIF